MSGEFKRQYAEQRAKKLADDAVGQAAAESEAERVTDLAAKARTEAERLISEVREAGAALQATRRKAHQDRFDRDLAIGWWYEPSVRALFERRPAGWRIRGSIVVPFHGSAKACEPGNQPKPRLVSLEEFARHGYYPRWSVNAAESFTAAINEIAKYVARCD